ncbi:MAG TPA: tetratricopeptide repeat protein [Phycisphaerae bacterium]
MPPERFVSRYREFAPYAAIFLLALLVRGVYLAQIRTAPLFDVLFLDAEAYDAWGQRIAAGDWLGHDVFYQAPLYPYFLGLMYSIVGHSLLAVRIIQMLAGSGACVVLAEAGRRFFSRRVGLTAGVLLAIYPPALFFDGLIQKAILDVFLMSLLLRLLGGLARRLTTAGLIGAGVVLGCFALTRENSLLLAVIVAVWLLVHFADRKLPRRCANVGWLALGMGLILVPVGLRNRWIGGSFLPTTAQAGPNFFIGNHAGATGILAPLRAGRDGPRYERIDATELAEAALGRSLTPAEVSRYWLQRSLDYIARQPADWLRLMFRKWCLVWNAFEISDGEDMQAYAASSWLLRGLTHVFHFGVLVPLALIGVLTTWRARRALWLLYALVLGFAASVALFFVFARYRHALVPPLMLFAAAGVWEVGSALAARRFARCAGYALAAAVLAMVVNWPILPGYGTGAATENNLGTRLGELGRLDEAVVHLQKALALNGNYPSAHVNLGRILTRQGKAAEAESHFRDAVRINPQYADGHYSLGRILLDQNRWTDAIQHLNAALQLDPRHLEAHKKLAVALGHERRWDEAERHLLEALRNAPQDAEARVNLGVVLESQHRVEEAFDQYLAVLRLRPDHAAARRNLDALLRDLSSAERARQRLEAAGAADPDDRLLRDLRAGIAPNR